jgi:hypothetical protein
MKEIRYEPAEVPGYSQGGTIVDGTAYFTANLYRSTVANGAEGKLYKADDYPFVAAFDPQSLEIQRTYSFRDTYDSTPLVFEGDDGEKLLLAHEFKEQRSTVVDLESGETVWQSDRNQPGAYFFGYSYYVRESGGRTFLCSSENGLHAFSLESKEDSWYVKGGGGVTPCVDQQRRWVFYQSPGRIAKIDAETGRVLRQVEVPAPSGCISWNTILVDDSSGHYVATYWYEKSLFGSALRVYDTDLRLVWEATGLPLSKKATPAYHGGTLFVGFGDGPQPEYLEQDPSLWKYMRAYDISSGAVVWQTDFTGFDVLQVPNVIYCNGMIVSESQNRQFYYHVFVQDAGSGRILSVHKHERTASSCAPPVLSAGRLYSGNLFTDSVFVSQIGTGEISDWHGAFANAQKNDMCAPIAALSRGPDLT